MKLAALAVIATTTLGCTRTVNLEARYGGVVALVAACATLIVPYTNNAPPEGKVLVLGIGLGGLGVGLVTGSAIGWRTVCRTERAAVAAAEVRTQRDVDRARAVELMKRATEAARSGICPVVSALDAEIAALDPGVVVVLRADAAARRCLSPH